MCLFRRLSTVLPIVGLLAGLPLAAAAQTAPLPNLGNMPFIKLWARTDYPVLDGKAQRGLYFGPTIALSCLEDYTEAPGGKRSVTYLDKARLELTDPGSGTVTAGLLAKELISGQMQVGHADFKPFEPASMPVAGDPVDSDAPTYASFAKVSSIDPSANRVANRQGQTVVETLNRAGQVGTDPGLARYGVTLVEYRTELGHNIPHVFLDFFNLRGVVAHVADDGSISFGEDRMINWVLVMGLPIAEPYWAVVPVGGANKWVLMQPYERRVVTYTPDNPAGFRVEMGNIGQHYQRWRHPDGTCAERPVAPPVDTSVPASTNATIVKNVGPWGTVFRYTIFGFQPNEPIAAWLTTPDGRVVGGRQQIRMQHDGRLQLFYASDQANQPGISSVTYQGDKSGHQAIVYFRILDRGPLPPHEPVPDGKSGIVTPRAGWQGTIFRATFTGFRPNEPLSFWFSWPDGRVGGTPEPFNVQHDGRITNFPIRTNELWPEGVWAVTMQGAKSNHQAIVYFRIIR